jgi:cell division protein FtsX
MENTSKRTVFILIAVAAVLYFAYLILTGALTGSDDTPVSAVGMTTEERAEADIAVLSDKLKGNADIKDIQISYENDAIKLYVNKEKSDQYSEQTANRLVEETKDIISDSRSELTLEKERYYVYVYGSDGRILSSDF